MVCTRLLLLARLLGRRGRREGRRGEGRHASRREACSRRVHTIPRLACAKPTPTWGVPQNPLISAFATYPTDTSEIREHTTQSARFGASVDMVSTVPRAYAAAKSTGGFAPRWASAVTPRDEAEASHSTYSAHGGKAGDSFQSERALCKKF